MADNQSSLHSSPNASPYPSSKRARHSTGLQDAGESIADFVERTVLQRTNQLDMSMIMCVKRLLDGVPQLQAHHAPPASHAQPPDHAQC